MARQKKSEIDAILEQLKNSYFDDSQDIDEQLPTDDKSDEDAELAAVLEKIFSESEDVWGEKDDEDPEQSGVNEETEINSALVTDVTTEEIAEPAQTVTTIEISKDEDKNEVVESQPEIDAIQTEEERVDDVLKSMFHFDDLPQAESDAIEEPMVDEQVLVETVEESEITVEPEVTAPEVLVAAKETEIGPVTEETSIIEENDFETEALSEKIIIEETAFDDPDEAEIADTLDAVYFETQEEVKEAPPKKKKILSPDEYVADTMQYSLSGIPFFKPQRDIDFSILESAPKGEDKPAEVDAPVAAESAEPKSDITDKDIALLMKLGYNGEINASGENAHAHKVIFDESKDYVPEKHKISHGFSGKEFTSRAQIPAIQKKFKQDRLIILIQAIIVSVLAIVAAVTDLIAVFSNTKSDSLLLICLICSVAALVVMFKQVFAGIYAILKFDTNQYSLPSLILLESIACSLIAGFVFALSTTHAALDTYYSVGGYAVLYMAMTAWSEWIDCFRESGIFNFIANNDKMYVAEKRTAADTLYNENRRKHAAIPEATDGRYIVKEARFVSGFYKKTTSTKTGMPKVFLSIGIIPATAIIMGMIIAIARDSLVSGVSGMTFILFLTAPLLSLASLSAIELLNYVKLNKSGSVFIGSEARNSVSDIRSLVLMDKDVREVTAFTPINPNKNADNPRKWLNIAGHVFETLGGPLSIIDGGKQTSSNIAHDVAINSIADNGIDIYFDSSMNILIGDRAYMQSHNIKVKTDVNLTGATRGAERSVIYMAFDKVPQIGFIVTSKVKKSFLRIITLLSNSNIGIEVKSYEPEINEYFFEMNLPDCQINTVKPLNHENTKESDVSDCGLVSSSPMDICRAIVYSRVIASDIAKNKAQRKMQSIIGFIASVALGALLCLPSNIGIIGVLQSYAPALLYAIAIAIMIPNIIQIIKVLKRK